MFFGLELQVLPSRRPKIGDFGVIRPILGLILLQFAFLEFLAILKALDVGNAGNGVLSEKKKAQKSDLRPPGSPHSGIENLKIFEIFKKSPIFKK